MEVYNMFTRNSSLAYDFLQSKDQIQDLYERLKTSFKICLTREELLELGFNFNIQEIQNMKKEIIKIFKKFDN
jgi:hypothetical protein